MMSKPGLDDRCAYCGAPIGEQESTMTYVIYERLDYQRRVIVRSLGAKGIMHLEPCARFYRRHQRYGGEQGPVKHVR